MSVLVSPDVSLVDATNATNMVHFACWCTPMQALCGAPLKGNHVDVEVECVVCCDMFPRCPRHTVDSF